jgi:multicomponent Na+:H+ antiporter subunit B
MESLVNLVLLTLLAAVTIAIVRTRDLISVVVLLGIYSFLMATVMIVLDAVDVAMTEAAVGAGVSTVLMLGTLYLTRIRESLPTHGAALPLFVAIVTALVLLWGTGDLPPFGAATNPVVAAGPDYMARSVPETGIPNVVTSTLASYRGYDTLGETVVVFTAGIGVLVLLKRPRRRRNDAKS